MNGYILYKHIVIQSFFYVYMEATLLKHTIMFFLKKTFLKKIIF
jgi:hypothetical protein